VKVLYWSSHILAALVIIMTAIPLFRAEAWWVRAFDFPRLQVALLGLLALTGLILFRPQGWGWAMTGLLLVAIVYQSLRILPYTPAWSKQVKDADMSKVQDSISILIANVLMPNREHDKLKAIIAECKPDVVLTMEVDDWWVEQLREIEAEYPHRVLKPIANTYGMALYSKHELPDAVVKGLLEDEVPSIHTKLKLRSGRIIELRCVHPKPPAPQESKTSLKRDAELLMVGKEVKPIQAPVIVMGDLNDVAWSHTTTLFQKVSGLLDPRQGRGLFSTFDARNPIMRWPLDHIFHSKHFELMEIRRMPKFGSDHFPVFVRLALTPEAPHKQEEPQADPEEKQDAQEKIEEGKRE
jgi:endonuclease/exonuclease/phosphatase (EEP) superfamily protein YafD